ncbi:guanosine-5'-triphosphate,3'-diphosphate pyrophosphatase [Gallaecimonas sp. GXIMD4217]|uniref:Ppx/GppA phosphatase family protein n=1 Tax=Gallaecimonas sp. GXIMD4217 TaxID=3131927 RepID=UPI00311AF6CA
MPEQRPLYAAIDLGSNSFHMLLVHERGGHAQTVAKIKRKVRLAAGLDGDYQLSREAMERGWDCLRLFAERLADVPKSNLRIVATATLRLAGNADVFLAEGARILGHPIDVISGLDEASLIYQGVAHTAGQCGRRLVVDIGGASTELVVGENFTPELLNSLEMGCVTFHERHFADGALDSARFDLAVADAMTRLAPVRDSYLGLGWDHCVGASGSVQAVQEVQLARGEDEEVTLARLERTLADTIACGHMDSLSLPGLAEDRKPVFAAGLAILIAIFRSLGINTMQASGGALREGIIYGLLPAPSLDVRSRTLASLEERFSLDSRQGALVSALARQLAGAMDDNGLALLDAAARLHELGLAVGFKGAARHGAYLLEHLELPGFSQVDRRILVALVGQQSGPINWSKIPASRRQLLLCHRLAVMFCGRRQPLPIHAFSLVQKEKGWLLRLPEGWLARHPLISGQLQEECDRLRVEGLHLDLN